MVAHLFRASNVPLYGTLLESPMFCVCMRVLITHKGLVVRMVETPAPAAAAMWISGVAVILSPGCMHGSDGEAILHERTFSLSIYRPYR